MEPLKIYLADLTYDTLEGAADSVFPLNVGFVASYCISKFGSKVDITLFKYIHELEKAIHDSPPDILGLSNYIWNKRVGKEMFKILSQENPNALTVWGGPNFPADMPSQQKFMDENTEVDIYVQIDGETGFSNIVEKALEEVPSGSATNLTQIYEIDKNTRERVLKETKPSIISKSTA